MSVFFDRYKESLIALILFLIPLNLLATYLIFYPTLALWLWCSRSRLLQLIQQTGRVVLPFYLFLLTLALSAPFGIDAARSLEAVLRLFIFSLGILLFYDGVKLDHYPRALAALFAGHVVSAFYTILVGVLPQLPDIFLGAVSESGQLTFSCLIAVGWIWTARSQRHACGMLGRWAPGAGVAVFLFLLLLAFSNLLGLAATSQIFLCGVFLAAGGGALFLLIRQARPGQFIPYLWLTILVLPLLGAALLVNLKRGPWAGVFAGLVVFLAMYARRLVLPMVALALCLALSLNPVRDRLAASAEHFFIAGGRNAIWSVGAELGARYPLGIGFRNSAFLQKFDPQIPANLKHFHNNFLNVFVEGGWLCLGVYLWWLAGLLRLAFSGDRRSTAGIFGIAAGCALLGSMVAGLVEYNFGDSKVTLALFFTLALLARARTDQPVLPADPLQQR